MPEFISLESVTLPTHGLKCWPEYFAAIGRDEKTFEFRKNDRDYHVGDILDLCEYVPEKNGVAGFYTGFIYRAIVTYIFKDGFGLPDGYCIMSIKRIANYYIQGIT